MPSNLFGVIGNYSRLSFRKPRLIAYLNCSIFLAIAVTSTPIVLSPFFLRGKEFFLERGVATSHSTVHTLPPSRKLFS